MLNKLVIFIIALLLPISGWAKPIIILDAGHGGRDPGAISSTGRTEAEYTARIARELRTALQAAGWEVKLTRQVDNPKAEQFVPLDRRRAMAIFVPAKVVLSLHYDAITHRKVSGMLFLIHPSKENHDVSLKLAEAIKREMPTDIPELEIVKSHRFRKADVKPSVLIEFGAINYPEEERRINDPKQRAQVVQGIVRAVEKFK